MSTNLKGFTLLGLIFIAGMFLSPVTRHVQVIEASNTNTLQDTASLNTANQLSLAFRQVSNHILPSIVTITTWGMVENDQGMQGVSPFEELFKNDPRFRQFFNEDDMQIVPKNGRGKGIQQRTMGQGSGFVISKDGHIVTNAHVVDGAQKILVRFDDGQEVYTDKVTIDERSDLAVLKIDGLKNLKPIPFGNSDETQVGDWVLALGSPFGLDISVSQGIISGKGRAPAINEREDYIQTDAAVNPGNSGGPLVNLHGEVIGINVAISSRSGGYDGVAFSIPSNLAKWVINSLIEHGKVDRSYLGVVIQPVTQSIAQQFGTETHRGALVSDIKDNTPAQKAGLQSGDIILKVDGKNVSSTVNLQGIVEQLKSGNTYDVLILREGKEMTISVKMEAMPDSYSLSSREPVLRGKKNSVTPGSFLDERLNIEVQEISDKIAEQLGLNNTEGVYISKVNPDSPLVDVGINIGDVILKYGKQKVGNLEDFKSASSVNKDSQEILLQIFSDNSTRFFVIRPAK